MAKALGIGGIFYRTDKPDELSDWYSKVLGIEFTSNYTSFKPEAMPQFGQTVLCHFPAESSYLGADEQRFMINFVVDDVRECIAQIEANGGQQIDDFVTESYGIFAWFSDIAGNKVELWQPMGDC